MTSPLAWRSPGQGDKSVVCGLRIDDECSDSHRVVCGISWTVDVQLIKKDKLVAIVLSRQGEIGVDLEYSIMDMRSWKLVLCTRGKSFTPLKKISIDCSTAQLWMT